MHSVGELVAKSNRVMWLYRCAVGQSLFDKVLAVIPLPICGYRTAA